MTEPLIDSGRVEEIFTDCLGGDLIIEGLINNFSLDEGKLEEHREEIIEMIRCLPLAFRLNEGGGWSFLQMCNDKNGTLWTGLHVVMEHLYVLSAGLEVGKFLLPRVFWEALPGGMPYIVFDIED